LHILRAELAADRNSFTEADFNAAVVLVNISKDKPEREQWLKDASAKELSIGKVRDDATAALQKLEARLTEGHQQLAEARAANDEAISRARAEHDRTVREHEKKMAGQAAEATRLLNSAQSDASAAANLRATLDARLERIKVAAQ
jgi:hypothetical protein